MKKIISFLLIFFVITPFAFAQLSKQPKIVIGVVVDQMRYDYLPRYWDNFCDDGFRKMVNEGYLQANNHFSYAPTFTGVGHASIFTGTIPGIHGIAGNRWYDRKEKRLVYCVEDSNVNTLGSNTDAGKFSPHRLKVNTIGDKIKVNNPESKVIGIALKDRAAILPVGHKADAAYWLDNSNGFFVTSSHYMEEIPAWVNDFNRQEKVKRLLASPWELLMPEEQYKASTSDDVPFEGVYKGEEKPVFPHPLPAMAEENGLGIIRDTPFGNTLTIDFAKTAIENEGLGEDEHTDFLSVSFSSPDYIGHNYGPHSMETEDNYLRLDRELADFIKYLEDKFGKDNFLLFLTADHAAADIPAYVGNNTGYFDYQDLERDLKNEVQQQFGHDLVSRVFNDQVYLDHEVISNNQLVLPEVKDFVMDQLMDKEGITGVVDPVKGTCLIEAQICGKIKNGYHHDRSGDITFILNPGWVDSNYKSGGTTHGSPFDYDTHVPLIWYGMGIRHQPSFKPTQIRDIAPTIGMILGTGGPNGTTGNYLEEVLEMVINNKVMKD